VWLVIDGVHFKFLLRGGDTSQGGSHGRCLTDHAVPSQREFEMHPIDTNNFYNS